MFFVIPILFLCTNPAFGAEYKVPLYDAKEKGRELVLKDSRSLSPRIQKITQNNFITLDQLLARKGNGRVFLFVGYSQYEPTYEEAIADRIAAYYPQMIGPDTIIITSEASRSQFGLGDAVQMIIAEHYGRFVGIHGDDRRDWRKDQRFIDEAFKGKPPTFVHLLNKSDLEASFRPTEGMPYGLFFAEINPHDLLLAVEDKGSTPGSFDMSHWVDLTNHLVSDVVAKGERHLSVIALEGGRRELRTLLTMTSTLAKLQAPPKKFVNFEFYLNALPALELVDDKGKFKADPFNAFNSKYRAVSALANTYSTWHDQNMLDLGINFTFRDIRTENPDVMAHPADIATQVDTMDIQFGLENRSFDFEALPNLTIRGDIVFQMGQALLDLQVIDKFNTFKAIAIGNKTIAMDEEPIDRHTTRYVTGIILGKLRAFKLHLLTSSDETRTYAIDIDSDGVKFAHRDAMKMIRDETKRRCRDIFD